jgi:hypothetical protein
VGFRGLLTVRGSSPFLVGTVYFLEERVLLVMGALF